MATKRTKVLIAGGGIGGLTALLALVSAALPPNYSSRPPPSVTSAGLPGNNAARIEGTWPRWCTARHILSRGVTIAPGITVIVSTTPLGEQAEARFGAPYCTAHRADF
jgi:salicylate hydroxylase